MSGAGAGARTGDGGCVGTGAGAGVGAGAGTVAGVCECAGDWDGVVAADSNTIEDTEGEITGDSTIEKRRKRREGRLKEEEEALAQAEIWNTIADQTKVDEKLEVDGNAGAAQMAADWAIDQSLAALRKAEEDDHGSNDSEQETKDDSDADVESM